MQKNEPLSWEGAVLWLRGQPDQDALVRACFYDDPLKDAATRYFHSSEWHAVQDLTKGLAKGKALDIGAGRGISSYALARDGWNTVALEPDGSAIVGAGAIRSLAEETGINIEVVEEFGETLPFADRTFDLVHCRQALHHARDLPQLCNEIGRVLKKGGMLIATREHVISSKNDLDLFLAAHPLHKLYGGENAFLLKEYTNAIVSGGMVLTHVLNPMESNINLYPETMDGMKTRLAKKLFFPFPTLIPNMLLRLIGQSLNWPGRIYTFVGRKT